MSNSSSRATRVDRAQAVIAEAELARVLGAYGFLAPPLEPEDDPPPAG